MSRVQDLLQDRHLFLVEAGMSVADVADRMSQLNVGAILVARDGRLCGLFSERDLMTRVVVERRDPAATMVSTVMTADLATIEESASLDEALARMQEYGCRHLPVMRGENVVGLLSMRDLMHHELSMKTEELNQMRAYIAAST